MIEPSPPKTTPEESRLSKLADKIRRATRLHAAPLGFGAARAASEPTMVLAALTGDPGAAPDLARRGADAVVVDLRKSGGSPKPAPASEAAVGALIAAKSEGESSACEQAGYDFVVFDPDSAAATALLEEAVGYVLAMPKDLSDADARALEGLALDAIDVGQIDGALTVRRQLDLRRVHGLTRKPLMARVRADVSVAELQALRDTNVVVVAADSADAVEKLRKTIDALPPRRRRKDGEERPMPLVPQAATVGVEEEEDEDEL